MQIRCIPFKTGAILIILVAGCSDSGTQPSGPQVESFQSVCLGEGPSIWTTRNPDAIRREFPAFTSQSPCLNNDRFDSGAVSSAGSVTFRAHHDTLFVDHDSAWYNCCSLIRFDLEGEGPEIDFIEVDTSTTFCHCMCYFNLSSFVAGLGYGTYTARLWTEGKDSLLAQANVYVPGPKLIWYEARCDTLFVHHDSRIANCCSRIVFGFEQQGTLLDLTEADSSDAPCDCVCPFDLTATVSGLAAGHYSVRLWDVETDRLLDSTMVVVSGCLPD
jgi:hypothetical protein